MMHTRKKERAGNPPVLEATQWEGKMEEFGSVLILRACFGLSST
jgi:hypothetical protein